MSSHIDELEILHNLSINIINALESDDQDKYIQILKYSLCQE